MKDARRRGITNYKVGSGSAGVGHGGRSRKAALVTDLDVESALRARFMTADLAAVDHPGAVADAEYERISGLARDIAAGRLTIGEARAQLRGAA